MIRVAINGFGRIGRNFLRCWLGRENSNLDIIAINNTSEPSTAAHLLKYDSLLGRLDADVQADQNSITVNGKTIKCVSDRNPLNLPWGELGIDLVIESTGVFVTEEGASKHIQAGAKKVLITAPGKGGDVGTYVMGVNHDDYDPSKKVISNASCTTNCLAPVAKVLNDNWGISTGLMTTVHAYTNDQKILDLPHKDMYRARAAAQNIIPTSTGAAAAVGLVIPELNGKLTGMAMRVPVPTGSVVDLVCSLDKSATADEINAAMKAAADGPMKGVLEYTTDPLVSSDIIDNPHSSVFASDFTKVIEGSANLVKVVSWYDNEWGYSSRTADLIAKIGAL